MSNQLPGRVTDTRTLGPGRARDRPGAGHLRHPDRHHPGHGRGARRRPGRARLDPQLDERRPRRHAARGRRARRRPAAVGASTSPASPPLAAGAAGLRDGPGAAGCSSARRVVEGIGGAAVLACGLAVLAHQFPPGPARVHATSVWGASVGLGIAAGAVLTRPARLGHRLARDVRRDRGRRRRAAGLAASGCCPSRRPVSPRRVDVAGLALLVAAMTLLVSATDPGPQRGRRGDRGARRARAPRAGRLRGRRGPRGRAAAGPGAAAQRAVPVGHHRARWCSAPG